MNEAYHSHHQAECAVIASNPQGFTFDIDARLLFRMLRARVMKHLDDGEWQALNLFSTNKTRLRKQNRASLKHLTAVRKYAQCLDPLRDLEKTYCVVRGNQTRL